MHTLQNVINLLKKVHTSIRTYVLCLLLTKGRKNCTEMANTLEISPKQLYAFLKEAKSHSLEIEKMLLAYAKQTRDKSHKRTLVLDPTSILKRYAQSFENLCYDRVGTTKHIEHCLVPIYAAVVDENIKIPLSLDFWVQKKIIGERRYKSKVAITQDLIEYLKNKLLDFDFISLDGAFPVPDMFSFFEETKHSFIMRIPKNRCITTSDGKRAQLKLHPALKLKRNERKKTIQAKLYGNMYYFTVHKRRAKNGLWETIYLVSNMDLSAKEQVAAYNLRWPMEKINRTTKQKFGSEQCQALKTAKQRAHILAGFLAHSIIEIAKNDKSKQSVDVVVNFLRKFHFNDLAALIAKPKKPKSTLKHDLVANSFQNRAQNFYNNAGEYNVLWT